MIPDDISRNSAIEFAQRLYSRLPAHYRVYDAAQGQPLYALLKVVGEQAANLRADIDALWDNFFIETCDDWVVPYIGALAGANLLSRPVGQSNRLDVWNTVQWRRGKGTPEMLQSLAQSISGWPAVMTEFFQSLGWSQNMNHLRMDRPLMPHLNRPAPLGLLNRARDPIAHAADFHPAPALAEPRGTAGSQGRYGIRTVGFFLSRLQTFPARGVTPAASAPGTTPAAGNSCFTFNPLFREAPLFSAAGIAIRRSDFLADPWSSFGNNGDIAVRQSGILLAADSAPSALLSNSGFKSFNFGGAGAGLVLDAANGLRILSPERFQQGSAQFTITALWGAGTRLGAVSTRRQKFTPGVAAPGTGQLQLQVTAAAGSTSTWFPGAVVSIRAKSGTLLRATDGIYAYLPPSKTPATFDISEDGSSFLASKLARAAEGQIYPPRLLTTSTRPAEAFLSLHKKAGLALAEPSRYGGAVTISANTDHSLLTISLRPSPGVTSIPPAELIVTNRGGESLLVYLPEIPAATLAGANVLVADDGSTYFVPADPAVLFLVQRQRSLSGLVLARASAGQSLPIPGFWPIQQRRPVAFNLCNSLRAAMLAPGELGVDPELGRFALPPGDPALAQGNFTVDYVEAFGGPVGALNYDRQLDPRAQANRIVDSSGDAATTAAVHTSLSDAIAAARDGDVIEISDSGTYGSAPIKLADATVKNLTIRAAAGQRPCLVFYQTSGAPAPSSISVTVPMTALTLNGLLLSGGPVLIQNPIQELTLTACTLDPEPAIVMLNLSDSSLSNSASCVLTGCITGGIVTAAGVTQLTIADSIVDAKSGTAISAARSLQLERVTVIGSMAANVFTASDCLLNDVAKVLDQQAGCVRFTRFEAGSVLPRRYECIPNDDQLRAAAAAKLRVLAPLFHSRRYGRPDYLQLASACRTEILSASESGAEPGAFAGGQNTIRLANLRTKLQEFLPAGLTAVLIAGT